ncbi:hypothetical protein [Kutzneria chonburiensis]|uniref:Uncharacterized protein n=1 Tax=Kutzneria chonburiensis TaxID=1483604 RepID=A0ABV6N246_9PSEU|nr:hypothetical protein [Kutzneria chonburiensis]
MSRTVVRRRNTARSAVLLWGTCPTCREIHYTLTTEGALPEHPVPGYGPGRPTCLGSGALPVPGTVEPAQTCFNASGNYGVVQMGAAA